MKHETLCDALNEISDPHISEAAASKKRVRLPWLGAIAAVLAAAILASALLPGRVPEPDDSIHLTNPDNITHPGVNTPQSCLLASPVYPRMVKYSEVNHKAWRESLAQQYDQPDNYAAGTEEFFRSSIQTILTDSSDNQTYSPLNVYMALAMLAEISDGSSRDQILGLLGADSIKALRTQAEHMWNAHYRNDGLSTSVLASSLWLENSLDYDPEVVQRLAQSYYASVFRGDLGSDLANEMLRSWLNEQTGGLLEEQVQGVELSDRSNLALATTIYYNVEWMDEFSEGKNTTGFFHGPAGDTEAVFMNRRMSDTYYRGDRFGAISLDLKDGGRMWLVLPEAGTSPAKLLENGQVLELLLDGRKDWEDKKDILINLSVPKFDIVSDRDLIPSLEKLGITDVFDPEKANFCDLLTQTEDYPYMSQVKHAARISIDEKGVLAAAFTVAERDAAAAEIEDKVDFILDRPFLFLIESQDGIPLFTGIVNTP